MPPVHLTCPHCGHAVPEQEEHPTPEKVIKEGKLKADWMPDPQLYEYKGLLWEVYFSEPKPESVERYFGKAP